MKKALVLGQGGLAGAYSAGFVSELCRELGPNYFDSVYCYSVGTTIGTFYVANQPDVIENTWRNYVTGKQLVKPWNIFNNKSLLDFEYLLDLFQNEKAHLDVEAVMNSTVDLRHVLINYKTGEFLYRKPNRENIFEMIQGACSLPWVSGPSKVGDELFLDAAFVHGGLPGIEKIAEDHDEVTVVLNYPLGHKPHWFWWPMIHIGFPAYSMLYPYSNELRGVFRKRLKEQKELSENLKKHRNVQVVAPKKLKLRFSGDAGSSKIGRLIDAGKEDAEKYVHSRNSR